jgi:hypothetical protein
MPDDGHGRLGGITWDDWVRRRAELEHAQKLAEIQLETARKLAEIKKGDPQAQLVGTAVDPQRNRSAADLVVDTSKARARAVARVLEELKDIRPLMTSESEYEAVKLRFAHSVVFEECDRNPQLRRLLENIQGHQQPVRFAMQIVAQKYTRKYSTVEKDWKRHKPRKPRPHAAVRIRRRK